MAIAINGAGTITGLSVGGLPDGTVDEDTLANNAVGSGKLASGVGGKILQCLSVTKKDVMQSSATSATLILSLAITPSSTGSKILMTAHVTGSQYYGVNNFHLKLMRDSTDIAIGDTNGSAQRATFQLQSHNTANSANASMTHLDSPSSTSSLTYKLMGWAEGDVWQINRSHRSTHATDCASVTSITLMEIGA